jgi:hypothetical protein
LAKDKDNGWEPSVIHNPGWLEPPPHPGPDRRGGDDKGELRLLTIHDFLNRPVSRPLIDKLLPASGQVNVLFGESNTFKSFLAIDMLSSVAHNISWHGQAVDPGPVLYVVTEGVQAAVTKRYRGWLEAHNIPETEWAKVKILDTPVALNHDEIVDKLIRTLNNQLAGVKLIVFDLQQGSMDGADGDADVAGPWVKGTQKLSAVTLATQLHITHTGWADTKRARGHTHLWGSFSTRLQAEGDADAKTDTLSVQRHKDEDSAGLIWNFNLDSILVAGGPATTLLPRLTGKPAGAETKTKGGRPRGDKGTGSQNISCRRSTSWPRMWSRAPASTAAASTRSRATISAPR